MFSVGGLLVLLQEEDNLLKEHALNKILQVVDEYWAEVSDQLALIEGLSEDEAFPSRELAASVASKCFYHLEEYDDALRLALASGKYLDVNSDSEYEVTIVGKCIEKYIALRQQEQQEGGKSKMDSRLEAIVEVMLEKCYSRGAFNQALGIALEAHRLDKVEDAITRSGSRVPEMLSYALHVSQSLVSSRAFRREVISVLVKLYESQRERCNFTELCSCLHYLGEVNKFSAVLERLVKDDNDAINLIAYQCAFDLNELQDQRFVRQLLATLPAPLVAPSGESEQADEKSLSPADTRRAMLRDILGKGLSTAMYLDFLYRNNRTDPLALKNLKGAVDQGRKNSVLHNAAIVSHGYLQAGTTVDAFLRNNLDWLGKASNWAKFSATASLGVIHKGNVKPSMQLLQPYLPQDVSSGVSNSPYSEGGALFALGLVHACDGASGEDGKAALAYLTTALDAHFENEVAREAIQHGASLGIGLVAMSSGDPGLIEKLQAIVYNDNAVAGEAASIAMGMIMLGGGGVKHSSTIEDMLSYGKDTGHEKITRGLGLAIAMIMFGQEEAGDVLAEQMCRDKDPLVRYGGMFVIGMAYAGTANNAAIRRLLHVAVSDVNNDVRRAAVTALGFVCVSVPDRLPELIALLSESYNPHVRYGACMALAIGCSQMEDPSEALTLLDHLKDDKTDFVRQAALLAQAMLLMQQNPETNSRCASLRAKLAEINADNKHSSTMTRLGALLANGILDAGGRNVCIELMSRSGFPKPPAMVGMLLWLQYWYWYPMMHMLSLSFTPTALIGVNKQLDMPVNFSVHCDADLKQFDYPKPLEEKKEKKQQRVKTAVLSTTAKAKARAALKKSDSNAAMDVSDDSAATEEKSDDKEKKDKPEGESCAAKLTNPLRVTRCQASHIRFKTSGERYSPVYKDSVHNYGVVVLVDNAPEQPETVVKVSVPPTGGQDDDDDDDEELTPPQPFEWTEP